MSDWLRKWQKDALVCRERQKTTVGDKIADTWQLPQEEFKRPKGMLREARDVDAGFLPKKYRKR